MLEDDAVTTETVLDNTSCANRKAARVVDEHINIELPGRIGWDSDILVELTAGVVVG